MKFDREPMKKGSNERELSQKYIGAIEKNIAKTNKTHG